MCWYILVTLRESHGKTAAWRFVSKQNVSQRSSRFVATVRCPNDRSHFVDPGHRYSSALYESKETRVSSLEKSKSSQCERPSTRLARTVCTTTTVRGFARATAKTSSSLRRGRDNVGLSKPCEESRYGPISTLSSQRHLHSTHTSDSQSEFNPTMTTGVSTSLASSTALASSSSPERIGKPPSLCRVACYSVFPVCIRNNERPK